MLFKLLHLPLEALLVHFVLLLVLCPRLDRNVLPHARQDVHALSNRDLLIPHYDCGLLFLEKVVGGASGFWLDYYFFFRLSFGSLRLQIRALYSVLIYEEALHDHLPQLHLVPCFVFQMQTVVLLSLRLGQQSPLLSKDLDCFRSTLRSLVFEFELLMHLFNKETERGRRSLGGMHIVGESWLLDEKLTAVLSLLIHKVAELLKLLHLTLVTLDVLLGEFMEADFVLLRHQIPPLRQLLSLLNHLQVFEVTSSLLVHKNEIG